MAKAKYDESKDETIAIMGLQANATTQFEARVMKYDGGDKKLQIRRMFLDTNATWQYSYKLGRYTKEEMKAVLRLMMALAPHFDIHDKNFDNEFEVGGVKFGENDTNNAEAEE